MVKPAYFCVVRSIGSEQSSSAAEVRCILCLSHLAVANHLVLYTMESGVRRPMYTKPTASGICTVCKCSFTSAVIPSVALAERHPGTQVQTVFHHLHGAGGGSGLRQHDQSEVFRVGKPRGWEV